MRMELQPYSAIAEYLKKEHTILIPVGAAEQYGPHLATGTELKIVEQIARDAGEKNGFAVTPVIPFNYSHMFLDYPGTMSINTKTVENYVSQMAHGLAKQGFRHFLFVNIHAGSLGPLESVSRSLRAKWGCVGGLIDVFSIMRDVAEVTYEIKQLPTGHASEVVTSVALHMAPEMMFMDRAVAPPVLRPFVDSVRTVSSSKVALGASTFQVFSDISDYTPLGMQGDPSAATAEKSKVIYESALNYIAEAATKFSGMILDPKLAAEAAE
ncbi:creatininase family protein [Breoghania sp.]|uniref:creatininase family protein n=1 Tax=Breoghania sp. TaxID=2065378 RepID=UPI0026241F88|nr:creatininase family protein [Breoghania sp.]MDJ0933332.1 creatininase family protein [Breoghania sp.]